MRTSTGSLDPDTDPEPWPEAHDPAARRRLDQVIAALPPGRFRQALEPECGSGELTWRLAERCDHVTAFDESPTAIRAARRSPRRQPNVELLVARIPDRMPLGGPFDLLCLVDCGHRFTEEALATVVDAMVTRAARAATFVASHWAGGIDLDHALQGTTVHDVVAARLDRHGFAPASPLAEHAGHVTETWAR
jgi:hypothetical protein